MSARIQACYKIVCIQHCPLAASKNLIYSMRRSQTMWTCVCDVDVAADHFKSTMLLHTAHGRVCARLFCPYLAGYFYANGILTQHPIRAACSVLRTFIILLLAICRLKKHISIPHDGQQRGCPMQCRTAFNYTPSYSMVLGPGWLHCLANELLGKLVYIYIVL